MLLTVSPGIPGSPLSPLGPVGPSGPEEPAAPGEPLSPCSPWDERKIHITPFIETSVTCCKSSHILLLLMRN